MTRITLYMISSLLGIYAISLRGRSELNDRLMSLKLRRLAVKNAESCIFTLNLISHFMIIGVAGPYSANTAEQRQINLDAMNQAAARLLEMGHIPLIGMNAALPVLEKANVSDGYKATMDISLTVISACDALLLLAESPGANKERDLMLAKGKPVFRSIEECRI